MPRIITAQLLTVWGWKKYFKIFKFIKDYISFSTLSKKLKTPFKPSIKNLYPVLGEDTDNTGFDRHYIYHPAWAARILAKNKSDFHVDISSTLSFSTLISAFMSVHFYDYRPADIKLSGLISKRADLLKLPFKNNEIKSLSCMHVVEHIGLGRYGDKINPNADKIAIDELKRVLAPEGNLLFVVPVGKPVIFFNAHRVYSYNQIISYFIGFKLVEFALIPRKSEGDLIINPDQSLIDSQDYACGCFWFKK
jgi:SAM-dependent methyltransferase